MSCNAQWTANTYNIEYSLDGGTLFSNSPTSATYDEDFNIYYPTKPGYTFAGWTMVNGDTSTALYSTYDGTTTQKPSIPWNPASTLVTSIRFINLTPVNGATVTLVAHWTPNTYTIEYYQGNNGTTDAATLLGTSTHTYDTISNLTLYSAFSANLPESVPNSTWTFAGWGTNQGSSSYTYTDGQSISNLTTTSNGTITLYAIFKRNVTFISGANGSKVTIEEQLYNPTSQSHTWYITVPILEDIPEWTPMGFNVDPTETITVDVSGSTSTRTESLFLSVTSTDINYYGLYKRNYMVNYYGGLNKEFVITRQSAYNYYRTLDTEFPTTTLVGMPTQGESGDLSGWMKAGYRDDTENANGEYEFGTYSVVPWGTNFYQVYRTFYQAEFYSGVNKEKTSYIQSNMSWYNSGQETTPATVTIDLLSNTDSKDIGGWSELGWRDDGTAGEKEYDYSETVEVPWNTNFYSIYYRNSVVDFYSGVNGNTVQQIRRVHYYNSNIETLPTTMTIDLKTAQDSENITNWTEVGWRRDSFGADKEYDYGQTNVEIPINGTTFRSVYSRPMTIIYNGNGSTGGNTNSYTRTIYLNTWLDMSDQEIVAATNGYSKNGYTFQSWNTKADGTGTQINEGENYYPELLYNDTPFTKTLYAQWGANIVSVVINRDNVEWTSDNNIQAALYKNGSSQYAYALANRIGGSTLTWNGVTSGTYDIYASKGTGALSTLVDTGADIVIDSSGTATIDYYTLTLNKGVGISAVSGAGTYLKNQQANIDATVTTGYTWQGWSVISGNTPD